MKEFAGYDIRLPFGPAAGVINGTNVELLTEQIRDCLRSPVSTAKLGSITWEGGSGNDHYGRVYYHNPVTKQSVNSMGLPNIGSDEAQTIYPELQNEADAQGKLLVPSISPGKGEDPLEVLPRMAEGFAEVGAPAIEVNYSCPNKITGDSGREPILAFDLEQMEEIDEEIVRRVGSGITVVRKLAPYVGDKRILIPKVAELFGRAGGDVWVNLSNTIGGQVIPDEMGNPALDVPGHMGGMSGEYTKAMARDQLIEFKRHIPRRIGVISCNGVTHGSEVFFRTEETGLADLTEGATIYLENEQRNISYGETGQRIAEQYAEMIETGQTGV